MGEISIPPLNPRKPKRKPQDPVPADVPPDAQDVPGPAPEPTPAVEEPVAAAEDEPVAEPAVKEQEEVPEEVLVPVGAGGAVQIPARARSVLRAASTSSGPSKGATGMPQYLSPGVYVEEIPSADKPIAGVGTSTAAFIGIYAGPV